MRHRLAGMLRNLGRGCFRAADRTHVLRGILAEWSARQLHLATVIMRVAGRNPVAAESDRQKGGK